MSSVTEDYLKYIYTVSNKHILKGSEELVNLGKLAEAMKVTPGTVTTMMKNLHNTGLVEYHPRSGVLLTNKGKQKAIAVLRRHRLIELFLVKVIGLDWRYVHDEAEILEHAISDRLLELIDNLLKHPSIDPHGDPIPAADGIMPSRNDTPLSEFEPVCELVIMRVEQHPNQFLEFLSQENLIPGTVINLNERNDMAGTMTILKRGVPTTISLETAKLIYVLRT